MSRWNRVKSSSSVGLHSRVWGHYSDHIMPGLSNRQTMSLLDDLAKQGATVQKRSKNVWRVTYPDGSVIVAHSSPSDVNWHRHLKRATEKAGLHWPLEDRATMKKIIKQKEGRGGMTQFVMSYGEHVKDYIGQESRDKVAQFLTGKGRATSPQIQAGTGLSQPTVARSLISLGWLQEAEREKEMFVGTNGLNRAKMNTYWSPAPEDVLSKVTFHATAKIPRKKKDGDEPKVKVAEQTAPEVVEQPETPAFMPDPSDSLPGFDAQPESQPEPQPQPEPEPEPEPLVVTEPAPAEGPMDPDQKDWFEEAANQEERAVKAEQRVTTLEGELGAAATRILALSGELADARAEDPTWAAPGIDQLPEGTTIADLFSTLRLMGLAPEIRLRRGDAS